MEEEFGNFGTIVGKVIEKDTQEINGDKDRLGKLTLDVGNNNGYVNIWDSKNSDNNKVLEFYRRIDHGDKIQLQGNLEENLYQDSYNRRLRTFVSNDNGVRLKKVGEDKKEKFVAALNGNILQRELRYENIERFDGSDVAKLEMKLAIFSLYNPETQENDLSTHEVLLNELNKEKEDLEGSNKEDSKAYKNINKLIKKAEDDDIGTQTKVLNKFYDLFNPLMYNIDILHLTAYKDVAEELAEKAEKHDNIGLGVQVNNYQDVDEFGVITGYINEVEIKKIYEVNKRKENNSDDDSLLDENW